MPFVTEGAIVGKTKISHGYFGPRETPSWNKRRYSRCRAGLPALALDWFNSRLRCTLPSESIGGTLADIRH